MPEPISNPKVTLSFISDLPIFQHEKPYELWLPPSEIPDSVPWTNCQFSEHSNIEIEDVRGSNTDFGYETTGFKFISNQLSECFARGSSWRSDDGLVQRYLEETVELLKGEFGAEKVLCFDWRVSIYFSR